MASFRQPLHDPTQLWLLPPSLDDLIARDANVRLLCDAIDAMDLTPLVDSYSHTGRPAYDPVSLLKVLLFAYSKGIRSSRKIEELLTFDVRFMWLARGDRPDFRTISRFRKQKWSSFGSVFVQSVHLCSRAGLVLFQSVSVDGTKVKANASKRSLKSPEEIEMEAIVQQVFREAEETDAAEDARFGTSRGDEIAEEFQDPTNRKQRLRELLDELERDSPKQVSTTDPESRFMQTRQGLALCFNVQAAVDSLDQVVVSQDVVTAAHDSEQLLPLVESATDNVGFKPDVVLADAGYSSEQTLLALSETGQTALIPGMVPPVRKGGDPAFDSGAFVHDPETDTLRCPAGRTLKLMGLYGPGSGQYRRYFAKGCKSCPHYRGCVPNGKGSRKVNVSVIADLRSGMRAAVQSEEGRATYAVRKETVEPVFGLLKHNLGFRQFVVRGIKGAKAESSLMFTVYNLTKWLKWARETLCRIFHSHLRAFERVLRTLLGQMTDALLYDATFNYT